MLRPAFGLATVAVVMGVIAGTIWIATPSESQLELPPALHAWSQAEPLPADYSADFGPLVAGFQRQVFRSFCGPASISTILRAYGSAKFDQLDVLPSLHKKLRTFYTGTTLAELAEIAEQAGLQTTLVYADSISADQFREQLKENLARKGDFVLVNYDRRVLKQSGAGHISALGAYDTAHDAFLVLDEAAYKYPFTWVPSDRLFEATRTRDGNRYRGFLIVSVNRLRR